MKSAMMRDRASGGGEFHADLEHVRAHMVGLLHSEIAYTAIPLSGSATYANEGVIAQLVPPGGKLLIHTNGVYGDRLIEIAAHLGHSSRHWRENFRAYQGRR
jgi:2-aminoethylphosphonate-pyruvate transaminase